jgi:hypothetical protein
MLASKTDKMAFLDGAKLVIDSAIRSLTLSLASSMFRSGTGSIGQIAAIDGSSGLITLVNAADIVQFEINQTLLINATDGGLTPVAAVGYVVAVNRSLGTLTVSTAMGAAGATPATWVGNTGYYLLVQGDNNLKIKGLEAWLPASAPSSAAFFGVDRSIDTWRLGGGRYDASSQSIEEGLIDASSMLAREGGMPDYCITNFASYSALEKSLGAKVQYVDVKNGEIGFRGIMINGANSSIKVFPDRNCPSKVAYLLQMDTWCLESLGDAPQILRYGDGLEMLRVANADAGEVRVGYYAQLRTNAPGWNAHVTLGA